jgi:hypothetical protein
MASGLPSATAEAYCHQLSLHAEWIWQHELPVLAATPAFVAAETIVDIGAGNGAFGSRLAHAYPQKRFLGVEPDPAIHAVGSRSTFPPNYDFVLGGYESVTGTHDLLLARHVIWFVPDRAALYAWSREHVRAVLLINWVQDTVEPAMPRRDAAMQDWKDRMERRPKELGGHLPPGETPTILAEWAAAGFLPSGSRTMVVEPSHPDDHRLYHHVVRLQVESANPEALARPLLDELYEWSLDPSARVTFVQTCDSLLNPALAGTMRSPAVIVS